MENFRKYLFITTGLLLLVTGFVFSASNTGYSAPPPDKDVLVINTQRQPVPTAPQGTTSIAGTVQVSNGETNPLPVRDVHAATRQPFQREILLGLPPGADGAEATVAVPNHRWLVIEYASARGATQTGQQLTFLIRTLRVNGGVLTTHYLPASQTLPAGPDTVFVAGLQVRLYAEPGSQVTVRADRSNGVSGSDAVFFSISGHLVDAP